MCSVEALRDFIHARLTEAAVEIFSVFLQTLNRQQEIQQTAGAVLQRGSRGDQGLWSRGENLILEEPETAAVREELLDVKQEAESVLENVFTQHRDDGGDSEREVSEEEKIQRRQQNADFRSSTERTRAVDSEQQTISGLDEEEEPNSSQIKEEQENKEEELKQEVNTFRIVYSGEPSEPDGELLLCDDSADRTPPSNTQQEDSETSSNPNMEYNWTDDWPSSRQSSPSASTDAEEKPHACQLCGKRFRYKSALRRHVRVHTGEKPHPCQICGKHYTDKSYLLVHMRVHTGEKPFSCETCGKCFNRQTCLLEHMRVHTGEKLYSCEVCSRGFSVKTNLVAHMRVHTGEKPYSCEVCGKCYRQQSGLLYHRKTHTGEKPYSCGTCGKSFTAKTNLLIHEAQHTHNATHNFQDRV